jgi:hypothetical protein
MCDAEGVRVCVGCVLMSDESVLMVSDEGVLLLVDDI